MRPQELAERQLAYLLESPDLLHPVFQPILSLVSGTVVGHEGFSRFELEPARPPNLWFAEATRVGMGADLQAMAIRRILGVAAQAGLPPGTFLSLNVSPQFLSHPAVAAAIATAEESRLVLELTEEEEVLDYRALRRAMTPYLRSGVRFAVDDAGAGFASMRHVIELQPAFVKLDAYLIRGMRSRQTLRAFLRAINGFTVEIGATLVAEGVETASDLGVLKETGFPLLAQGFAIARPAAAWPGVRVAVTKAWRREAAPMAPPSVGNGRPGVTQSAPIPIENAVNIGAALGPGLRRAGIEDLDTLRRLGAVEGWRRLRAIDPDLATDWAVAALEGAIRGTRWGSVPSAERRRLIATIAKIGEG
ncbi:MAG: EAL domain-containing protein [Chloroflexota bacterium]